MPEASNTSTLKYLDFDLEIGQVVEGVYPVVVLRSPAGEMRSDMRFPFDEIKLRLHLVELENALLRSASTRRVTPSKEQKEVEQFGSTLFNALFTEDVRKWYEVSLERARSQGNGLRIKLRILAPELAALPWEFLYDSHRGKYLCFSRQTPIVRYLTLSPPIQPVEVFPPLRILGMIASPRNLPKLEVTVEKERLEQPLQELQQKGLVELHWLEGQTWRDLQQVLWSGPWHIFHFIGHGGFETSRDEGFLAFCDELGERADISATNLALLLTEHKSLKLVVLNACEGARSSQKDVFSSTASILLKGDIPAVLAMQYSITDRAAVEFSRTFYSALAKGLPVDAAVAEGRVAISLAFIETIEWGTPILFLRADDGVLFDVQKQPESESQTSDPGSSVALSQPAAVEDQVVSLEQLTPGVSSQPEPVDQPVEAVNEGGLEPPLITLQPEPTLSTEATKSPEKKKPGLKRVREILGDPRIWGAMAVAVTLIAVFGILFWPNIRVWFNRSPADLPVIETTPRPKSTVTLTPTPIVTLTPTPTLPPPLPISQFLTLPYKAAPGVVSAKDGMELVYVPSGEFLMGAAETDVLAYDDEKPQHIVKLDAYWIDRTEVTNAMYARCVTNGACYPLSYPDSATHADYYENPDFANFPVLHATWEDAKNFCQWAGRRLPTEAEWEKAARGTDGRLYPWGDGRPDCSRTNYSNPDQSCTMDIQPVGSYPEAISPYGALDMAGNALEWVSDIYSEEYYRTSSIENPTGPPDGIDRILRGGSWNEEVRFVRASNRGHTGAYYEGYNAGIRCALSADQVLPPVYSAPSARDGMVQMFVPAGEFTMGASFDNAGQEGPQHKVALDAFWMDETEVTNAMFRQFVDQTGYQTDAEKDEGYWYDQAAGEWQQDGDWLHPQGPGSGIEGLKFPVVQASWNDAAAYCEWVGRRLPTETEWEKAARGIDSRQYPWGEGEVSGKHANFADVNYDDEPPADPNIDDGYATTSPVGNYLAGISPYGALDMAGNAWEWVADWYQEDFYAESPEANPPGPKDGDARVLRGGGWADSAWNVRTTARRFNAPGFTVEVYGFRCAQSVGKPTDTVAFVSDKSGNDDIFVINSNGTGLTRLTTDSGEDYDPAWSRDGALIAFVSNREGVTQLYVMDSDGDNQRRVIPDEVVYARSPSWSPDGQWLVFMSDREGSQDIYKVKIDDTNLTRLTHNPGEDRQPVWSPDGTQILFVSDRKGDEDELYILDAEGGEDQLLRRIPVPGYMEGRGVWSPDGRSILVESADASDKRDIFLVNLADYSVELITDLDYDRNPSFASDSQRFVFDSSVNGRQILIDSLDQNIDPEQVQTGLAKSFMPAWSPVIGDERIAFVGRYDGDNEIYTLSLDRTYSIRLTDNVSDETDTRVSPDGQWVAFTTNQGTDTDTYKVCLASAQVPGAEWRCLTDNSSGITARYPAWSPDGKELVFAYARNENWDIFRIGLDGTGLIQLTNDPSEDRSPSWAPDGSYIVFASNRSGQDDLYRMDSADGGNLAILVNTPAYDWSPVISPGGNILIFSSSQGFETSYLTEVYIQDLKTGKQTRLTENRSSNEVAIWSTDGRRIYYESTQFFGIYDIWVMNSDGSDPRNLTEDERSDKFH